MKNKFSEKWIRSSALALAAVFLFSAVTSPALEKAAAPDAGMPDTNVAPTAVAEATNAVAVEATNSAPAETATETKSGGTRVSREAVVTIGSNAELKENETAEAVVAVGGNAIAKGNVKDAVVAVFGNAEVSGEVRDAVVAVMGNVKLLPGAKVRGDVVSVGGTVEKAEGAEVSGQIQEVNFGALGLLKVEWLKSWFKQCVLKLRPLAPSVGWVWAVAGVYLLIYLLVAIAFPRPVQRCVDELTRRPATTFLIGLMTKILIPVVTLILLVTGIGIFIVPFLFAAVLFAGIFGKVALLEYFGQQLGRAFSRSAVLGPLASLLLGAALLTVLYIVPVLGLLTLLITGMWALGAAVTALFSGTRREMPERPQQPPTMPPAAYAPAASTAAASAPPVAGIAPMPVSTPEGAAQISAAPPTIAAPPVAAPEAWAFPRAGFWERMGAGFLDIVLVSILGGLVGGPPLGFLVALAYFAGMWAWKGTTVGGIVLKLKVVRLDGQPVTFPVALVRGLAAAFSVIVFFLGFLWIAWDKEKQGWHD